MIEPIIKEITVPVSQNEAFQVFTSQIARWWPVKTHSLSASDGKLPRNVTIAPHAGGAIVEELHDGTTANWGVITEWEPGQKLAFTWHLRRPQSQQTHVSVEFLPDGDATSLHWFTAAGRQWEKRASVAANSIFPAGMWCSANLRRESLPNFGSRPDCTEATTRTRRRSGWPRSTRSPAPVCATASGQT